MPGITETTKLKAWRVTAEVRDGGRESEQVSILIATRGDAAEATRLGHAAVTAQAAHPPAQVVVDEVKAIEPVWVWDTSREF